MIQAKIKDLRNSFYNTSFYNALTEHSLEKGLGFVVFWTFISSLIGTVIMAMGIVPPVFTFSPEAYVEEHYPSELVVRIENGIASTNVEEPYFLSFDNSEESEGQRVGVYLDTKRDVSIADVQSYDALGVLTKDTLVMSKSDGESRMFSLADVSDFTLDKDTTLRYAEMGMKWARVLVVPACLFIAIFIAIFSVLIYLFLNLFGALIVMLVGKIHKRSLSYKTAYVIALFATGPIILADTILMVFGIMVIPFSVTLVIFLAVILANIRTIPEETTSVESLEKLG